MKRTLALLLIVGLVFPLSAVMVGCGESGPTGVEEADQEVLTEEQEAGERAYSQDIEEPPVPKDIK